MKVYLVQNSCKFATKTTQRQRPTGAIERTGTVILSETDITTSGFDSDSDDDDDDYDDKRLIGERECNIFGTHLKGEDFWNATHELSVSLKTSPSKTNSMYLKIQGNCLTELCRIFGSDIKLQVGLEINGEVALNSKEMRIYGYSLYSSELCKRSKYDSYCENWEVDAPPSMLTWMSSTCTKLWISILITGSFHRSITDAYIPNKSSVSAKILNEKIGTDVEIHANDGTSISCHKLFLMAQSPVFAAMFGNGFKESKTNIIKTDIPAKSLKPFIDYLYFYEVSGPIEDPQIAIDLLMAGHKYDVKTMEAKMKKILLTSPTAIFTPDEAIRLFIFVRNVDAFHRIKVKVIKILKSFGREALSKSEEFEKLFKSPTAAEVVKELVLDFVEAID